ncbi:MAG: excalibur calcium-binding domain-containing protein [Mycobacterium sp.]
MLVRTMIAAAILGAVAVGVAPAASAAPYKNCSEARDAGDVNITSDSDKYGPHLDSDDDGIGCEA